MNFIIFGCFFLFSFFFLFLLYINLDCEPLSCNINCIFNSAIHHAYIYMLNNPLHIGVKLQLSLVYYKEYTLSFDFFTNVFSWLCFSFIYLVLTVQSQLSLFNFWPEVKNWCVVLPAVWAHLWSYFPSFVTLQQVILHQYKCLYHN